MLVQILVMWLLVGAAILWFVRDEKRRRGFVASAHALGFSRVPRDPELSPDYRPRPVPLVTRPAVQSSADRAFLENLAKAAKTKA